MNVVAAAGGSGGHCYPALAFLQACKNRHPDWVLTLAVDRGSRTLGLEQESGAARSVVEIESVKYAGIRSLVSPGFWGRLFKGFTESRKLLKELKADAVVGFGGYGSFPVVWEAASMRIPTVIHEQNALMGRANRVLARRVGHVAVSLTLAEPIRGKARVAQTGFPLRLNLRRLDREAVVKRLELDPEKKTLLIFGGSQGSRFINQLTADLLRRFGRELGASWQILHLTGRGDVLEAAPDVPGLMVRRWAYSREMDALYTAADLVISRAGSATLHELCFFEKPAILIPYPHANAHQVCNAKVMADAGGAWMVEEAECSVEALKGLIDRASADPDALGRMSQNASKTLKINGAEALVDLVESIR